MNNRINIAVIDDGVDFKALKPKHKPKYNLQITDNLKIKRWKNKEHNRLNHATVCAGIILKYQPQAVISSIKILDTESDKGNINQLIKALYWCVDHDIDIVNLSLGSVYFNDIEKVRRCINDVTSKGLIIVAAVNNNNEFTVPACLSNVIGVKCDKSFTNDYYHFNTCPIYGVDILSSGKHKIDLKTGELVTKGTNSFAAPFITAMVAKILLENNQVSFEQIKYQLYKNANNYNREQYNPHFYLSTDWVANYEPFNTEKINETCKERTVLINSIPDNMPEFQLEIRELAIKKYKNIINFINNPNLMYDTFYNSESLPGKLWDFHYYSKIINSAISEMNFDIDIPVILFKKLNELSIKIHSLFKKDGFYSVVVSDILNFENGLCEVIPHNTKIWNFLCFIYNKYKCDVIICDMYNTDNCMYNLQDYNYDMIISASDDIVICCQSNNSLKELKIPNTEDVDDIYSAIKQILLD